MISSFIRMAAVGRIAAIAILAGWAAQGAAQPAAPAQPADAPPANAAPAAVAAPAPAPPSPASLIFIPYDKMTGPKFGPDKSVLLPYAEFLRLRGAVEGKHESPDFRPSASISQATYTGKVEGAVARFDAEFTIEVLARPSDWLEVPLPFAGAPIASASVAGEGGEKTAASLSALEGAQGLRLALRGEGRRTVKLKLAAPLAPSGAGRKLQFGVPRAAAATLKLAVDGDVEIDAAPGTLPASARPAEGGGTEIEASCGATETIALAYRPKAATGAAAAGRLAVDQSITLAVAPKTAGVAVALAIRPLSGEVNAIEIAIPPGVRVLACSGPFVARWNVQDESNLKETRKMEIALVRAVAEPFEIAMEAQAEAGEAPERLVAPEFRVAGAAKESGTISFSADPGLDIWPAEAAGLEAASAQNPGGGAARAFRFAQPGWRLVLERRPVAARLRADGLILYQVTDEFVRLNSHHHLAISGRGIFGATFEVPAGYELREAGPPELVSGFRQQDRKIELNFRGEQTQAADIDLRLSRPRKADEAKLALEPISVVGAEEDAGSLALAAPAALRATETKAQGLQAADVRELAARIQPLLSPDLVPALGYRYFTPLFAGEAAIERQNASVTCDTTELASVTPSLMRIDATLNYTVEFSAIDQFKLLVPSAAGEKVRFSGEDIKEKIRALEAPGEDGLTTWTIRLQRRVIGPFALGVSFDHPLEEAAPGKPVNAKVPLARAVGVARETGHLAVSRGENLEVRVAKAEGLELRDAKELPRALLGAFLGFRYFDPKRAALELELVRHELEGVLGAVIRRMHIETVLSDQREATHEVIFEIQNNREQHLQLGLPAGMEIWSAFVRGAPVRPTRRDDGARLIELTKSETRDAAFRVRLVLRQTLPGGEMGMFGKLDFAPPAPINIPVLRATWKLYLPQKYRYLSFDGKMRHETGGGKSWIEPAAEKLLNDLPASAAGGIAQAALSPPVAQVGAAYGADETEEERRARMAGAALDVPIVRVGSQFEFSMLSGVGPIRARFWKAKPLLIVQGSFALALFAGLLVAMARRRRVDIGFVAALVALVGASLADGFTGRMFATALAVSSLAFVVALAVAAARRAHAMRNIVLAPEEWIPAPVGMGGFERSSESEDRSAPAGARDNSDAPTTPGAVPESAPPPEAAEVPDATAAPDSSAPAAEALESKPRKRKKRHEGDDEASS